MTSQAQPIGAMLICDQTGGRMFTQWPPTVWQEGDAKTIYGDSGGYRVVPLYATSSPDAAGSGGEARCPASPAHADIKETIEDAADDWQAKGYTSALAEVRDMAAVGRSLLEALPKGYCYMDSPAEIVSDLQNDLDEVRGLTPIDATQTREAELVAAVRNEVINTPETADFMAGVPIEAMHQRERWAADHDAGKTPFDWFWLIGYLSQKAASAQVAGDTEKALHHTISTAAALANWHLAITGADTSMRPGIADPVAAFNARGGA